jgi:short-subunit dehydrogenase involved in D-alanine esterification of teichoic acids
VVLSFPMVLSKPQQFLTNMFVPKGIALITGSAQGIGRGIALRLAKDGFDIALNDVTTKHKQLTAVATEIESLGRKTCIVHADVSEEDQVKQMVHSSVDRLGGLDVVCLQTQSGWLYADYHLTDGSKCGCCTNEPIFV